MWALIIRYTHRHTHTHTQNYHPKMEYSIDLSASNKLNATSTKICNDCFPNANCICNQSKAPLGNCVSCFRRSVPPPKKVQEFCTILSQQGSHFKESPTKKVKERKKKDRERERENIFENAMRKLKRKQKVVECTKPQLCSKNAITAGHI